MASPPFSSSAVSRIVGVWLGIAFALNVTGALARGPRALPQALIFGMFIAGTLAFFYVPALNAWGHSVSLRALTLFQAWRIIPGLAFFYYYYRLGLLPADFVSVAGFGDIAVAVVAPVAASFARSASPHRWKVLIAFHLFGMADLAAVVITATRNALADPVTMAPLRELPLGLLPTILVPLTLIAHVIALAQIRRASRTV
jgi:hypothetical protein